MTNTPERKLLWLSTDPGHDDCCCILLALHEPSISLLGVSTVHGNAGVHHTTINAAKCLEAFGAPASVKVYPGAAKPLIGEPHPAVNIHGNDGLGGVEGLPDASDPGVQARIVDAADPVFQGGLPAIVGMRDAALSALSQGKKLYLGVTGSCTDAALFLAAYPALAKQAIAQIVCMGGGAGIGNITAAAEFNIYVDPFAAQIVLECGLPVYCIPLNVTHQMLFHADAQRHLLDPLADASASDPAAPMPAAATPLRYTLSTLMTFFANTYRDVFGFQDGPPIHDALVVAYLAHPELFSSVQCRVDVELSGDHSRGAYIVDVYNRKPGQILNAEMARALDVPAILRTFFAAFEKADHASPLNAGLKTIPVDVQIPDRAVRAALPPPLL